MGSDGGGLNVVVAVDSFVDVVGLATAVGDGR